MKILTRYQRPYNILQDLQEEMNSLFGKSGNHETSSGRNPLALSSEAGDLGSNATQWVPPIDVKEENNGYIILADIPGIEPKDVQVSIENNVLTITGERAVEKTQEEGKYTRIERCYGTFYRSFALPTSANGTKINASYKNGVLKIILPKKEDVTPKKIEVQVES